MNINSKQVKVGAIFSYVLILANTFFSFVVTPYILHVLGESSYGAYKSIGAITSSLLILDFGLGGMVQRYVAHYDADKNDRGIEKFLSMALIESIVLAFIAAIVSVFFYFGIPSIYQEGFNTSEIQLAQKLFLIAGIGIVAHIIENVFNGIITGFNNFIFGNGIKIIRLFVRIALIFLLLKRINSPTFIVAMDSVIVVITIVVEIAYIKRKYGILPRIQFGDLDSGLFKESFIYAGLLFVSSIVSQVNSNLDNVVIGAFRGTALVTIYSFGITIFSAYQQLSTAISGVMLPTVTKTLKENKVELVVNLIVKVGRIQFLLLGATVTAFAVIGKTFIGLWLGSGYEDVYYISLILMFPALFELCVNVCLAVLRAENKLGFRTIVITCTTILNLIITIVGVKFWSYYAAAIGTAVSLIIGSVIVMSVYYKTKLGYPMLKIYKRIFSRIWLCLFISGIVLFISARYICGGWIAFICNALIFCITYAILLLLFGLTQSEKDAVLVFKKR